MRNKKGQFVKGQHASLATEFKKGQHWRKPKLYWDKAWLENEYVTLEKSAETIACEQGCHHNNILYFLSKHGIPTRSMSEIRSKKYWRLSGPANGMYGRTGEDNPNWKGGVTPERQALYSSQDWAEAVKAVWARDEATCQRCGEVGEHIHHIVSFAVPELRTDADNLILLCRKCHNWVHSRKNTEYDFLKGGDE